MRKILEVTSIIQYEFFYSNSLLLRAQGNLFLFRLLINPLFNCSVTLLIILIIKYYTITTEKYY